MLALALLLLQGSGPALSEIDALAKAKDVDALTRLLTPLPTGVGNPFRVLRTGGAYDVGRFGWRALSLKPQDSAAEYVVISTPLTSQDVGEILLRREGNRLTYVPETDPLGIQIRRHDLDVKFLIDQKSVEIQDRLAISSAPTHKGPFIYRMSPNYKVRDIKNSKGAAVPFTQAGGVVAAARPSGADTYTIQYRATVDLPLYAGSITPKEASLTNDYWYPMIARQPAPYTITIRSPKDWVAIGQGELQSSEETANGRVTKYRMDLPVIYYSVSTAPFRSVSQTIDAKKYTAWSSRLSEGQMRAQNELYAGIINYYERTFGKYPFSGFGVIDSAIYGGGALEAYSFCTWGGGLPFEDAHEPAHTWWGGILNNTYLGSFWNESFAVFSDGLYHREAPIGNVAERRLAFIQDGAASSGFTRASLAASGADIGPGASELGYGKGAKVLQMLEQLIGTEAMIGTMRTWLNADAGKAVDWADYERVVLRTNGPGLKTFFDDWMRRPGFAELSVSQPQFRNGQVSLDVGFARDAYRMPLDVMLQNADGSRKFVTLDIKAAGVVTIPSERRPDLVSVDPWRRAVRQIRPDERPIEIGSTVGRMRRYTDPSTRDYLPGFGSGNLGDLPNDLDGVFIVGHPDTTPAMRRLCERAGFDVKGQSLTYKGTTINLSQGAAIAVVDLPQGGRCAIGLGKTRVRPSAGRARLALVDDLGRFLRGETEPKTSGHLTFKL